MFVQCHVRVPCHVRAMFLVPWSSCHVCAVLSCACSAMFVPCHVRVLCSFRAVPFSCRAMLSPSLLGGRPRRLGRCCWRSWRCWQGSLVAFAISSASPVPVTVIAVARLRHCRHRLRRHRHRRRQRRPCKKLYDSLPGPPTLAERDPKLRIENLTRRYRDD